MTRPRTTHQEQSPALAVVILGAIAVLTGVAVFAVTELVGRVAG